MILTTHALTGAVIGKYVDNWAAVAGISVVFHYAMDILKHGDYYEENRTLFQGFIKEFMDLLIGGIILSAIIYFNKPSTGEIYRMLWGVGLSLFPDLLTLLYDKFKLRFLAPAYWLNRWVHDLFYTDADRAWIPRNLSNDFILSSIAMIVLLFF